MWHLSERVLQIPTRYLMFYYQLVNVVNNHLMRSALVEHADKTFTGPQLHSQLGLLLLLLRQRQELNCSRRAPGYFTLIGEKAPPAARDSSEVARL